MTQLRAKPLCQIVAWQTACPTSGLVSPAIMPERRALAGKLNPVKKGWRARRASQKPARGMPCAGSDKISTATLPDACGRLRFAGCAKTLNLETRKSWKPTHKDFSGSPTVCVSGSGGAGEIRLESYAISGKPRPQRSGGAAVRCTRCWADFARRF